jgi:hypothetical protein
MLIVLCALVLGSCVILPQPWTRADGRPIESAQLEADDTACHGEMDKAAGENKALAMLILGPSQEMLSAYAGCMVNRGYRPVH